MYQATDKCFDMTEAWAWLLEHPELDLFALSKRRSFYLPYLDISDPEAATQLYKIVSFDSYNKLFYMKQNYTSQHSKL
jgi:hypothetical protein